MYMPAKAGYDHFEYTLFKTCPVLLSILVGKSEHIHGRICQNLAVGGSDDGVYYRNSIAALYHIALSIYLIIVLGIADVIDVYIPSQMLFI